MVVERTRRAGPDAFLLSIDAYDKEHDGAFADFIGRLTIVIEYASLYGDKKVVRWSRTGDRSG